MICFFLQIILLSLSEISLLLEIFVNENASNYARRFIFYSNLIAHYLYLYTNDNMNVFRTYKQH